MRKLLAGLLLVVFALSNQINAQQNGRAEAGAQAQQIPLLSDLFARYEDFNRLYADKRKAGANLPAVGGKGKIVEFHGELHRLGLETTSIARRFSSGFPSKTSTVPKTVRG